MNYQVFLETRAKRELESLPKNVRKQLANVIDDLEKEPRSPCSKKLIQKEGYRIRKGDYRLLYTIDDKERRVTIYRIGHRREIYR